MEAARTWKDQLERRFLLDRAAAKELLTAIAQRMPPVTYHPGCTRTLVVTTYLDTEEHYYFHNVTGTRSVKLRVREYLAPLDNHTRYAHRDECYLERKQRTDQLRTKQRVSINKRDLGGILAGVTALPGTCPESTAVRGELAAQRPQPTVVSAYERIVFGDDRALRITFDERIGFYLPPDGLYDQAPALTPERLGEPVARGPGRIVEVKYAAADPIPSWLEQRLSALPASPTYSKFSDGMQAIRAERRPAKLTQRLVLPKRMRE